VNQAPQNNSRQVQGHGHPLGSPLAQGHTGTFGSTGLQGATGFFGGPFRKFVDLPDEWAVAYRLRRPGWMPASVHKIFVRIWKYLRKKGWVRGLRHHYFEDEPEAERICRAYAESVDKAELPLLIGVCPVMDKVLSEMFKRP